MIHRTFRSVTKGADAGSSKAVGCLPHASARPFTDLIISPASLGLRDPGRTGRRGQHQMGRRLVFRRMALHPLPRQPLRLGDLCGRHLGGKIVTPLRKPDRLLRRSQVHPTYQRGHSRQALRGRRDTFCPSRLLKKSDFVRSSTLDARTVLNPNGNKQESKRLFDAPKNVFQQPARSYCPPGVAILGGFAEPCDCLLVVLRDAIAIEVSYDRPDRSARGRTPDRQPCGAR